VTRDCQNLDAYLDGELSPGDNALFAAHLAGCPACREAIDEQLWIDGLLRAPAIAQLEAPSAALVASFRGALARRIYFSQRAAGAAAAAAILFATLGWFVAQSSPPDDSGRINAVVHDVATPDAAPPAATFVGGPDVIAVPVPSLHPDVTIVRLYPVCEPQYSAQASLDQTTMGDDLAWPNLNGG
jgi:anti-sigma factor RsiW